MSGVWLHRAIAAVLLLALSACTPGLNWREVQLGRLSTLLPCKPDHGSRMVVLDEQSIGMDMAGCEASTAMFAISRIHASSAAQAPALLRALRKASLESVRMRDVHPSANSGNTQTSFDLLADGTSPDGRPLQARFKWLQADDEVYQIAVYAERIDQAETENIVSEARIR